MQTWIVSGWVHFVVGFVVGWVVFKRPAFAQKMIDKIKVKLGMAPKTP